MKPKYQGIPGLVLTGTSFDYDPQAGWSQSATYSGTLEEIRTGFATKVSAESALGNSIRCEIRTAGSGNRAEGTITIPDSEPSLGVADTTVAQWSLDWTRKEQPLVAAPSLKDLTSDQIQALSAYAADTNQKRPYVAAGDVAASCIWPPGATGNAALVICFNTATGTPAEMNEATALAERGVTSFVSVAPVLKRTSNFRRGDQQRLAVTNVGRVFATYELGTMESFPDSWAGTLPCAQWLKTDMSLRYSGLRLQVEATFEGFTKAEQALYQPAKEPDVGACCTGVHGAEVCAETTAAACAALGGVFMGLQVDCSGLFNPCACAALPMMGGGAFNSCCYTDGAGVKQCADDINALQCLFKAGQWRAGQTCASLPCT